jgi:hypothetical protein
MLCQCIQEPSLLATHLIQDADCYTSQVSFDMEKAFDQVEYHFNIQAFRAFGVPEIMIIMAYKTTH